MKYKDILDGILKEGFYIDAQVGEDTYYFKSTEGIVLSLTTPHDGTANCWMLRADYIESFDRWGNCWFEEFFNNEHSFDTTMCKIREFKKNKESNLADIIY